MSFDNSRTEYLLGRAGTERLAAAYVCVFGVGGVGGYVCEALVRAGVGHITIVDGDIVVSSNINRQVIAHTGTVGRPKVEVMRERLLAINPDCNIIAHQLFYLPENADVIDISAFDYIADAVDTVSAKIEIICRASAAGVPVISSMGAGNKLYPERFRISDIYSTSVCPLARVMRHELKLRGIRCLPVVWSDEPPREYAEKPRAEIREDGSRGKTPPGSISFVPSTAGLIMAGKIIRDLAGIKDKND